MNKIMTSEVHDIIRHMSSELFERIKQRQENQDFNDLSYKNLIDYGFDDVSVNQKNVQDLLRDEHKRLKDNEDLQVYKKVMQLFFKQKRRVLSYKQLLHLCNKYDLWIMYPDLFKGVIPERCVKHINDFKRIYNESLNLPLFYQSQHSFIDVADESIYGIKKSDKTLMICSPKDNVKKEINTLEVDRHLFKQRKNFNGFIKEFKKSNSFNPKDVTKIVSESLMMIDDPIVISPYIINSTHLLFEIVTAWGPEGQDELVFDFTQN